MSYSPRHDKRLAPPFELVGLDRIELSTPRLSGACSSHLSYRPINQAVKPGKRTLQSGPAGNAGVQRARRAPHSLKTG